MNKISLSILAILLLSACTPDPPATSILPWNGLKLATDTKCPKTPAPYTCDYAKVFEAKIEVDKGAPISVNAIQSCTSKKITWKYKDEVKDAPPFFIIFNPKVFPGDRNKYNPISKATKIRGEVMNQELTINTGAWNQTDIPECLNYMIVVPDKGILDPVFIIKK